MLGVGGSSSNDYFELKTDNFPRSLVFWPLRTAQDGILLDQGRRGRGQERKGGGEDGNRHVRAGLTRMIYSVLLVFITGLYEKHSIPAFEREVFA